jgi:hypothetical protein
VRSWLVAKLLVIIALFINMLVIAASPSSLSLVRACRPLFVIERMRNVRRIASNIVQVVPKILNVAVLLCIHIMLFGVLGYAMFSGKSLETCDGPRNRDLFCSTFVSDCDLPPCCSDYFASFHSSVLQRTS